MWITGSCRWCCRARAPTLDHMKWTWRVGALRPGAENVDWTDAGAGADWASARSDAVVALTSLVAREGRQEYRIQVGDVDGIVHPGLTEDGVVDLDGLGDSLPLARF